MVTTPNYNLDADATLGGNNASDYTIPSQKAVKGYVDSQTGAAPTFANLTGSPYDNTNLANALNEKANDNAVVHLTGSEIITGGKTFENTDSTNVSNIGITLKSDNFHKGTSPSTNRLNSIDFTDDNNVAICKFSAIQTSDGWTGFLAGAGTDLTNTTNNLLMISNDSNSKLLLIPPTTTHNNCAVRRDFFNNNAVTHTPSTAVGSSTQPVYIASDGKATACSNSIPTVDTTLSTTSTNPVQNKVIASALDGKLDGFTLQFAGNWTGGVHAVNFVTINYSECNSENGVFIKLSMVNSHGNGQAGRFLQDAILNVKYTGEVAGTLYRYFAVPIDQSSSEYYGSHYYGDVFWVNDTTNKIVKFYVLMHQFSYTYQTPYFRLNASTKGVITQPTGRGAEEYSTGTRAWTTINWFETDQIYNATSTKPQSGGAVAGAISTKQDTLVSGTNIKTVNNTSLLGSGNISVATSAQGAKADSALQSGDDISELNNDAGYITGITSSDVTTALGYTPYNSTNPNGYTSNKGTVTKVNNNSPDSSGNVTISIPSAVTESTVSGWGFTKNTGTVTSVNNVSPVNGNVTLSIPTATSDLTNDSGFITNSALSGYATENYVDTGLATKQATLVSGTNIKTINGEALLGSGDITIQGGGLNYAMVITDYTGA